MYGVVDLRPPFFVSNASTFGLIVFFGGKNFCPLSFAHGTLARLGMHGQDSFPPVALIAPIVLIAPGRASKFNYAELCRNKLPSL